jgi:hypothetical protein
MTPYVSPELYRRYAKTVLEHTNARQRVENGRVVRGLSDAEIAEILGLRIEEARDIRCIAELDLPESGLWFEADRWKEESFHRGGRARQ